MQLFSHGLGQRRADVLADFRLAGEDLDHFILADVQPRADVLGGILASAPATTPAAAAGGLGVRGVQQVEHQDAAAQSIQEVAPVQLETVTRFLSQLVALGLEFRCDDR